MRRFFKRFELIPGQHRPRPIRNGLIFGGIIALGAYMMFTASVPFLPAKGETFQAEFSAADYIRAGTPIRVAGAQVGEVEGIERQADGDGALISFRITDEDVELKDDASAAIYGRTLLGFFYEIDLEPGSDSASALEPDGVIAEERTTYAADVDEVLRPFDQFGRAGLRGFFKEMETALRGPEAQQANKAAGPALEAIAPGVDALQGERRGDLGRLVSSTGQAMRALGRNEEQLAGLLGSGATTLQAVASQRESLGRLIQDGPETMASVQTTMVRLRSTLDELDPVARELRPGVRRLDEAAAEARDTLAAADPLLEQADQTFDALDPAVGNLRSAAREGRPLMDRLDPTLDRTNDTILPHLKQVDPDTGLRDYAAIGPFFSAVGSLGAAFGPEAHNASFTAGLSERGASGLPCTSLLSDPTKEELFNCEKLSESFAALFGSGATGAGSADGAASENGPGNDPRRGGKGAGVSASGAASANGSGDEAPSGDRPPEAPAETESGSGNLLDNILGGLGL
ncbi:MAG: MCE family protein [Thermoleophilaceae bacterium]|nr:MCE family protein [Thermoleophilaceae bacterium]